MEKGTNTSIAANGYVFDALVAGPERGEVVLMLHGFPQTAEEWRAQISALSDAGYRVVAPNQRGYSAGARPTEVEAYAIPHLIADVVAIADALGAARFHVVGHDWGGAVAWHVAAGHPDRVMSVTVVSTPHPKALSRSMREGEQREKSAYMAFFASPGAEDAFLADGGALLRKMFTTSGLSEEQAEPYVRAMQQPGMLTGGLNWYRGIQPGSGEAAHITVPALYIWGVEDLALGREAAEWTAEFVDGPYRFVALEGVGHWVPETAADEVNALLMNHLAGVSR